MLGTICTSRAQLSAAVVGLVGGSLATLIVQGLLSASSGFSATDFRFGFAADAAKGAAGTGAVVTEVRTATGRGVQLSQGLSGDGTSAEETLAHGVNVSAVQDDGEQAFDLDYDLDKARIAERVAARGAEGGAGQGAEQVAGADAERGAEQGAERGIGQDSAHGTAQASEQDIAASTAAFHPGALNGPSAGSLSLQEQAGDQALAALWGGRDSGSGPYNYTQVERRLIRIGAAPRWVCTMRRGDGYWYHYPCRQAKSSWCCRRKVGNVGVAAERGFSPVHAGPTGDQCGPNGRSAQPAARLVLHFLILAENALWHSTGPVWKHFLAGAPPEAWRIWVHCSAGHLGTSECQEELDKHLHPVQAYVVPTVFSVRPRDLVSPMLQLLRFALNCSNVPSCPNVTAGAHEKFIFFAATAFPVKPFSHIHRELSRFPESSDFCIYPVNYPHRWKNATNALAIAASQWSVLASMDAKRFVASQPEPSDHIMQFRVPKGMNIHKMGCADEDLVFPAVFGLYRGNLANTSKHAKAPGWQFFEGVGNFTHKAPRAYHAQGCCRTWLSMIPFQVAMSSENRLLAQMLLDEETEVGVWKDHAIWSFRQVGRTTLALLRNSRYLFARKFDMPVNATAFAEVLFDAPR